MSEIDDSIDYAENYMEQDDYSDNESEGTDLKIADKRAHHNALERKRRDHIKDSFSSLRNAIPLLQGEKPASHKASRAQILKKAAEYIDLMRRKNNDHQKDIDTLKKENKLLEEKIRALEELKCAGQLKNGNKSQPTANNARSKSLIVSNASNGSTSTINGSNSSLSTNSSAVSSSSMTNSSNLNNDGTSLLQNRIKSESISSFEANSDDSENLIDNHNTETVVQIVKKGVVSSGNVKLSTPNGTTLLVNGTIIKQATNSQQTHSLLNGPPNKRKKTLIIAANPSSIISK